MPPTSDVRLHEGPCKVDNVEERCSERYRLFGDRVLARVLTYPYRRELAYRRCKQGAAFRNRHDNRRPAMERIRDVTIDAA